MSTTLELINKLQDRIEALENRTIEKVKCKPCKGFGFVFVLANEEGCRVCGGTGHTLTLSPLEEK